MEEVPGAGRGRERWWRHRERRLDVAAPSPSAVTQRAEAARLVAEILTREAHALHGYLTRPERLPGWDQAAFLEARGFLLTPDELVSSAAASTGCSTSCAPPTPPTHPGALPVRVLAFGFPFLPAEEAP